MSQQHPLLAALKPVAEVVGAELVSADALDETDIPLEWEGRIVGGFRLLPMQTALERLVAAIELELGASLDQLDRADKQRAIRMLEHRGAFLLRKSIEDVADLMGVSRITIYNYLNTVRQGDVA